MPRSSSGMSMNSMRSGTSSARKIGRTRSSQVCAFARTDVEEAAGVGFGEVQRHVDGILDVDEVAPLLAVAELGAIALEQLDAPVSRIWLERFVRRRCASSPLWSSFGPKTLKYLIPQTLSAKPLRAA